MARIHHRAVGSSPLLSSRVVETGWQRQSQLNVLGGEELVDLFRAPRGVSLVHRTTSDKDSWLSVVVQAGEDSGQRAAVAFVAVLGELNDENSLVAGPVFDAPTRRVGSWSSRH